MGPGMIEGLGEVCRDETSSLTCESIIRCHSLSLARRDLSSYCCKYRNEVNQKGHESSHTGDA